MRLRAPLAILLFLALTPVFTQAHSGRAGAAGRHSVLILGDSVFSVFRWALATQQPFWTHGYDVVNEAWGCQTLMTAGCPGSGGKSALQRLADHRGEDIDAVIVGTGYNDVVNGTIRTAMRKIVAETRSRGIPVFWATYYEGGNMARKARDFNNSLRAEASHHPNVTVLEWNTHAKGHKGWFNGRSVHLNGTGGTQLGVFLVSALDDYFAGADAG